MMNVAEAIEKRRSIRSYSDKNVEKEKIEKVLQAGRLAPSALNRQDWRFLLVRNKETLKTMSRLCGDQSHVADADGIICLCGTNPSYQMSCGEYAYHLDLAIAGAFMTLQATELELATCWIGDFNQQKVKTLLRIPEQVRVAAILTLGYPHFTPHPTKRKKLSEVVCVENYDQPYPE